MLRDHQFQTLITWTGNLGSGTMDYRSYERDFILNVSGKPELSGSSSSTFLGDDTAYNPEDMLLASVSSCHMLWYLHLCADRGVVVLEYKDRAQAVLSEQPDGSGRFTQIILNPEVVISADGDIDLANDLHQEANKMCFIANSLNCPVTHRPHCTNG